MLYNNIIFFMPKFVFFLILKFKNLLNNLKSKNPVLRKILYVLLKSQLNNSINLKFHPKLDF